LTRNEISAVVDSRPSILLQCGKGSEACKIIAVANG
jgi:hypothetical protein